MDARQAVQDGAREGPWLLLHNTGSQGALTAAVRPGAGHTSYSSTSKEGLKIFLERVVISIPKAVHTVAG